MLIIRLVLISACLVIVGCRDSVADIQESMLTLASAATKLSNVVESTCRYKNPPAGIGDAELIAISTAHDPSLVRPFGGYALRARCQDGHGVVLVCDRHATRALIEDSACTPHLDVHHWKNPNPIPCGFTIPLASVCPAQ